MSNWLRQIMRHLSLGVSAANVDMAKSYEEAVRALNTLQSNAAYIEKAREERNRLRHLSLALTAQASSRVGIEPADLDKLSVIHVSGTKGKGSTCAFCEKILHSHGYKTGFFSSPHLVEVRERIRINGKPLSKEAFSSYFWDCYSKLDKTKDQYNGHMPQYFRFLTVMAFHVFLQEKVDVAVIEVGIGGAYDSTNILRHPVVCGISSLGMDHMSILGDTIDKIAWQKAGIFKPGVPAVTVPQPENSLQVLIDRASEIGCPLYLSPNLESYKWGGHDMKLGIDGRMQHLNASLALQLCRIWLMNHGKSLEERQTQVLNGGFELGSIIPGESFPVTNEMAKGLRCCTWPGRTQTISRPGLTYYLDGAHTSRSIKHCVEWFQEASQKEAARLGDGKVVKILLFNSTGDRKPESLLEHLVVCNFDAATFCPNVACLGISNADQTNHMVTPRSVLDRCTINRNAWIGLLEGNSHSDLSESTSEESPCKKIRPDSSLNSTVPSFKLSGSNSSVSSKELAVNAPSVDIGNLSVENDCAKVTSLLFESIEDSLLWASQDREPYLVGYSSRPRASVPEHLSNPTHIQILCTGSIHLIGGILKLIQPDIND